MTIREFGGWTANASALGVRGIHTCIVGVVSVALSLGLLSGCSAGSNCSLSQAQCDGNVAMNCSPIETGNGTDYRWQSSNCGGGVCKLSVTGFAFCAASPDPDPRCDGMREAICDGKTMRNCVDHYASAPGTVCVLCNEYDANPGYDRDLAGAVCTQHAPPNANCPSSPAGSGISAACDGNDLLQCEEGLELNRQPCDTGFCVGVDQCALSKEPDPNCPPNEPAPSFCDGNTTVKCDHGYRVAESPCPAGEVCEAWPTACSSPTDTTCTIALCVAH